VLNALILRDLLTSKDMDRKLSLLGWLSWLKRVKRPGMALLSGRKGLIVGIANARSLAYAIARAAHGEGAELALTYQNDRLKPRVEAAAVEFGEAMILPCDVNVDGQIADVAQSLAPLGHLDFVVHAVASAKREELGGRFVDTSRDGFGMALETSCYSLVALAHALEPLMAASPHGASMLTLSYFGAQKVVPNYNIMGVAKAALEASVRYLAADLGAQGIRVNALSPGPIKTLSAAGIKGFRTMLGASGDLSPLGGGVDAQDVAKAALFALSDLSAAVTGEVLHVDKGMHILAATPKES
jgi:enoyl-[acyl-carrier protein] reductase I